jgi:hypothetical protein
MRTPKTPHVTVVVTLALALPGCANTTLPKMPDGPSWSLTDKKPPPPPAPGVVRSSLGARPESANSTYEYRGGRDPVTGAATPRENTTPPAITRTVTGAHSQPNRPSGQMIEVKKGDTLHGLSLTHHVSLKALMEANNLTRPTIVPGQKLMLPTS